MYARSNLILATFCNLEAYRRHWQRRSSVYVSDKMANTHKRSSEIETRHIEVAWCMVMHDCKT